MIPPYKYYPKLACIKGINIFNNNNADNIQVNIDISFVLPDINFSIVNDNTPKVIIW